ncbi:CDP-alcohol phosphatidyltransferase-domain-containing protein [Thelephora terrestris]|uniref:CDP-alcohol phosphatidyltransferase-domain-containing protein n=1 Tax=Thelephora terrestris TaxID=56493 RepID=A0A9P6L231_9AGAM|nr:CDP-alcohol phosphatidyltransferase-domain-containing protein [Thelephora terrestris]
MQPLSATPTRHSVKACLNSSLLRPSSVSLRNTCLPRHLICASFRPATASSRRTFALSSRSFQQPTPRDHEPEEKTKPSVSETLHPVKAEKVWTIPNVLTISRILSCPLLGYAILIDDFYVATGLLVYAGLTDFVDGYLARRYNMGSVLGSILDPAADKMLMTTLVVTLTVRELVPLPLCVIILGRDALLSLSAFWIRWKTLPPPRYWDFSLPSAEVQPTLISKVNTALQLLLMGVTTVSPILTIDIALQLQALQWTVAGTTIWSGLSYLVGRGGFRVVKPVTKGPPTPP